jgi:hypothetical protein
MSRVRNALTATAFSYAQTTIGILFALYLTRFLIHTLGRDLYGMWLATGALLGYAGLADLGILSVMPWLFAEAEGARDSAKLRSLLAHGLAAAFVGAIAVAAVLLGLWCFVPRVLHLSTADVRVLRGPVLLGAAIGVFSYPLHIFMALRNGLQDFAFMGKWSLIQTALAFATTVAVTQAGGGLYGVALGAAVPGLVMGVVALLRTAFRSPEVFRGWPRLSWSMVRSIAGAGAGVWMGSVGVQLAFASDNVLIAFVARRTLIPTFTVTSRVALTTMQMAWSLPDSASVGLAQLNAEKQSKRVGEVVVALLRLNLLGAGLIACGVLAGNAGFVTAWVGADLFGGPYLNAAFALDVVAMSMAHGLVVPAAVLGQRVRVGIVTLVNGAVHILVALVLGRAFGLVGIACSTAVSAVLTTIPAGLALLAELTPLTPRMLLRDVLAPWLLRVVPCSLAAALAGWILANSAATAGLGRHGVAVVSLVAGAGAGLLYLFGMRSIMRNLPFGPRVGRVLRALRLV